MSAVDADAPAAPGPHCQYGDVHPFTAAQNAATYGALVAAVRRAVPAGARVLDIGCGRGELLKALAAAGFAAVGCDADPTCVDVAAAHGPTVACAAEELAPDVFAAAGLGGEFHAAVLSHVLEHLADPAAALRRAAALAPVVVAAVPNPYHAPYLWRALFRRPIGTVNPGHRQAWDWMHFRTLVEGHAGLRVARWATDTVALPLPYLLRRALFAIGLLGVLERGPMRWCFPRFGRSIIAVCGPGEALRNAYLAGRTEAPGSR